eukprot:1374859-Amorphochlora_amoeboformis.AAC.1
MLKRRPTRIELTHDDIKELSEARKVSSAHDVKGDSKVMKSGKARGFLDTKGPVRSNLAHEPIVPIDTRRSISSFQALEV